LDHEAKLARSESVVQLGLVVDEVRQLLVLVAGGDKLSLVLVATLARL
jgi:hypothetical protein